MGVSYKLSTIFAVTALGFSLAAPVVAQEEEGVEEVVVTARRVEERLQDVPISISVFSQDELDNRNITDPAELATYTPSLQSNSQFGSQNASFTIRGFVQDNNTAPSVGVYFADVIMPRGAASVTAGDGAGPGSMFDLQSVQVLKGPQGTLFGRNTTGGAILLVPKKPTFGFDGYLDGSVGNYNMKRLQGAMNVPLGEMARMRFGFDTMDREGHLKNISPIGPDDFGDVGYFAARASLVLDLAPELENYTILSYTHSETNGFTQRPTDCNPDAKLSVPQVGQVLPTGYYCTEQLARLAQANDFYAVENNVYNALNEMEQWQAINTTTWNATDNLTIKNIVSYAELRNLQQSSVFGNYWLVDQNAPSAGNTVRPGFEGTAITPNVVASAPDTPLNYQNTLTEELQFQGSNFDSRLTWQGGIYYEHSLPIDGPTGTMGWNFAECSSLGYDAATNTPEYSNCKLPYSFISGFSRALRETEYTDLAVYAQGTYKLTDQLNATLGLRYTDDKSSGYGQDFRYNFFNGAPSPFSGSDITCGNAEAGGNEPDCKIYQKQHSHAPTGVFDLEYHPTNDMMVYGKYSRGYRQGLVNPRSLPPFDTFGQEKVDAYEVGLKTKWLGMVPGYINVATFYNDFQDQQLLISFVDNESGDTQTSICACGQSEIYGIELDGSVSLLEDLRLTGGLAYMHTKLVGFEEPVPPAPYDEVIPGNKVGAPLTQSPEWKGSVTAAYTLPLSDNVGQITAAATYSYTGDYLARTTDHGKIDSFNTVNLNVNWNSVFSGPMDLSLFGTNVTGEEYYTYATDLYDTVLGTVSSVQGLPRMYGLRLRYNFGDAS